MTYEEFRDWVANLPQAANREDEDFGQGPLPESFKPDYAEGCCSAPVDGHISYSCCLPNGHPGPCIGWSSYGVFQMKDRLSYRSGLSAALTSKPYEETP